MSENRKNIYRCKKCKGFVVTVDLVEGVTPFTIMCKATEGCKGTMYSSFYGVDQTLEATYEWYKPTSFDCYPIECRQGMKDHVEMGGLDIRPCGWDAFSKNCKYRAEDRQRCGMKIPGRNNDYCGPYDCPGGLQ